MTSTEALAKIAGLEALAEDLVIREQLTGQSHAAERAAVQMTLNDLWGYVDFSSIQV